MRPDVWGQGFLFAFSGLDGETSCENDFVLVANETPLDWKVYGSTPVSFALADAKGKRLEICQSEVIANDHLSMTVKTSDDTQLLVKMAMVDRETVMGSVSANERAGKIRLQIVRPEWCENVDVLDDGVVFQSESHSLIFRMTGARGSIEDVVVVLEADSTWDVLFVVTRNENFDLDGAAFEETYREREAFLRTLPNPPETFLGDDTLKTYLKAASVIKVNLHTPQGRIPFNWSTPDRVPHEKMWLWDSAMHAIGLRHLDTNLAQDQIKSVLAHIADDGFLAHSIDPAGKASNIIQPPILGWAAWEVYQTKPDVAFLRYVYPRLKKFFGFFERQRDRNNNGLCEWEDKNASGMDNSSRFDDGRGFDALDLNCFLANEFGLMAKMAEEIGGDAATDAEEWRARCEGLSSLINSHLWNDGEGFYFDRYFNSRLSKIKSECGFLPLFAGVASEQQAKRLTEHLLNEDEFWTACPVPSIAKDEPTYSRDMWRGPTWLNYNYFIVRGLLRYGYDSIAKELVEKTISEVTRVYLQDGVIFEYYDADAKESPRDMPRKGKVGGEKWLHTVVRDYHWSASVIFALALEGFE